MPTNAMHATYTKEDSKEVPQIDYSEEELDYRKSLILSMDRARRMRDTTHDEFDGMTYLEYFETNAKAASSYIPPKKNEEDIRIVTGITEDKQKTLLSTTLNFNFEPNIMAFDKDNFEIVDLGENMEAMIKKSRLIESPDYEMKKPLIYRELFDQGTCWVEDVTVEFTEVEKKISGSDKFKKAIQMERNWDSKVSKVYKEIRSNLLSGPSVWLGNIKEFFMQRQPYVFTREYITYEEAERLYGSWERFEFVPKRTTTLTGESGEESVAYRNWSLLQIEEGFVEVLKYQNLPKNEFQILLNGITMLPAGFPLSALTGRNIYTIVKGDVNPIPFFAYSRSGPATSKVDQSMIDEFYRLGILKTQKSFAPPLANNTGNVISRKIFLPGSITDDVSPEELQPIGDVDGVSQSEFAMMQYIKSQIDEKSMSPVFQGNDLPGRQTATEVLELKKQSEKKLGLALWGVMNFERNLAWLRLNNIINSWTEAEDSKVNKVKNGLESVFRRIEVEDTFDDGVNGMRMIEFSEAMRMPQQIQAEERLLSRKKGKNVRKFIINPKILKNLKINWQILIEPTAKDSDDLERARFNQTVLEGYQMFGPMAFNQDHLKTQYAMKNKMDKEKLFVREMPGMMGPGMEGPGGVPGGTVNDRMRQAVGGRGSGVSRNPAAKNPAAKVPLR